jgi:hypothetical protein
MCGSDRTGSSEDSDGDEEDESSMMNWVIPPAHPPQARGLPQIISHPDPMQCLCIYVRNRGLPCPWLNTYFVSKFIVMVKLY